MTALAWLARYLTHKEMRWGGPPFWAPWFDQSRYASSAVAFAHGDLGAASHWYPLAYPLMVAPFTWVMPVDPFVIPDVILLVATLYGFAAVMRRFGFSAATSTIVFLFGTLATRKVANLWSEPWTTTLTAPLMWGLIAQTLSIIEPSVAPPRRREMVTLGLLAGALPLVRPADLLAGATAVAIALLTLGAQRRLRPAGFGALVLAGVAICLPYLALHLAIYGPSTTDYMRASAVQGFALADLPFKAYVIIVSARPWFPKSPSLIEALPWLVVGFAGLGLIATLGSRRERIALGVITLVAIPQAILFLAYTDLQPPGLWRFGNAHYFKWLFPLVAAGTWVWLRVLLRRDALGPALLALLVVLIPMAIRPVPRTVNDETPARMLLFDGAATERDWSRRYFAPSTITDRLGSMNNIGRFHQIPDKHGERALAVSRLFVGPARRDDPEEAAPYRTAQAPYARYAVHLSPGIPCWFKRQSACRLAEPAGQPPTVGLNAP